MYRAASKVSLRQFIIKEKALSLTGMEKSIRVSFRIAYSLRTKSIRDARVRAIHPMLSLTTIINCVIVITLKSLNIQPK